MVLGVIPARYNSSRLPGKPLELIQGKPMIIHVAERASLIKCLDELVIATDDNRIREVVLKHGYKCGITSSNHESGTDRVAEIARNYDSKTFVINIQGDMPFFDPKIADSIIDGMYEYYNCDVITAYNAINEKKWLYDSNIVKVVTDINDRALYFSRLPLRHSSHFKRHIGVYGYRNCVLQRLTKIKKADLEESEKLEQLRALQHGFYIQTVRVDTDCGQEVNCKEDLRLANEYRRN